MSLYQEVEFLTIALARYFMISPDTTETMSTISFTKLASCKRQDTQTQAMHHSLFPKRSPIWPLASCTHRKETQKMKLKLLLFKTACVSYLS